MAHSVRLVAPPQVMKEKHLKLRFLSGGDTPEDERQRDWRKSITHTAMGWRMAERLQQEQLLPGDTLDIAFTLDHNDHPDFGGLELSLRDFRKVRTTRNAEDEGKVDPNRLKQHQAI